MKLLTTIIFSVVCLNLFAVVEHKKVQETDIPYTTELGSEIATLTVKDFLDLKPRDYKRITGERLGIKKSIQLKAAQRYAKREMRKAGADINSGLYILFAILGLGWLAMGLLDDWDGNNWIVNIILTALCWLPGLIHALVKKSEYY